MVEKSKPRIRVKWRLAVLPTCRYDVIDATSAERIDTDAEPDTEMGDAGAMRNRLAKTINAVNLIRASNQVSGAEGMPMASRELLTTG